MVLKKILELVITIKSVRLVFLSIEFLAGEGMYTV